MKRLLVIGAGGFGREIFEWIQDIPADQRDWEFGGFLDSNIAALEDFNNSYGVVGTPQTFIPSKNDLLICAIGDPRTKLRLCRQLKDRGGIFLTFKHPTAIVGRTCSIGEGCIFCPGVVVTTNVVLGNFVTLNVYATVGHDVKVKDGCTLNGHSDITGHAVLGEGVLLGSHACVLPGAEVGDYALVGAGSVVVRKARAYSTVFGVPAKLVYEAKKSESAD